MKTSAIRAGADTTGSGVARYIIRTALKAAHAIWRWQMRRETLRELSRLDSHTLKDIGVDRSEINSIVFGGGSCRRRKLSDKR